MTDEQTPKPITVSDSELVILDFWREQDIFAKSLKQREGSETYIFYDGPPFATGTPHYGHILASVIKDAVPRYQTMRGKYVPRRWGWDCHGLPIENIVEKELGFTHKKDILAYGVDKFNELCRSRVLTYVDEWKKIIPRIGRWADMDEPYFTMSRDFMESVWWAFKQLYEKGLLYEDYRSMYICPRCETTLSQSEVAEGYKNVKDLSTTVKFHLKPGQKFGDGKQTTDEATFVLAWTTTPWTLPGNVALAVGSRIQYTVLRVQGIPELLIIAHERIEEVLKGKEIEIVAENISGADIVGLEYEPLFDSYASDLTLQNHQNGWKIYAADFVTTQEGTGVVHIAPAFGTDDMELGRQQQLPFVQHLGTDGIIRDEVKELAGRSVKPIEDVQSTDVEVVKYLAAKNLLFAKAQYEHSYPHCWRCDTPLINYATSSWFVNIEAQKEALLASADAIHWSPTHMKSGRWGNWLEGARDWSISRQRFWASVIPVWRCQACSQTTVFGSVNELERSSGQVVSDLHKHIVDTITVPCSCGAIMKRVPDVLDTWFDSGSMPYGSIHYPFENVEEFERTSPANFIAEGQDQTRAWFYYLHVLTTSLFGHHAFENVIVNGIILAEDGKKMSKRLQNYPDPMYIVNRYGADALRCYLLSSPLVKAEDLNFNEQGVDEVFKKVILRLKNVLAFYQLYPDPSDTVVTSQPAHILDRWILARLHQLTSEVTHAMDHYEIESALRPIEQFIDDLSVWYVRRSRDRMKEQGSEQASQTLRLTLRELSKVMAPFTPFIAEEIYRAAAGSNDPESVHLTDWPILGAVDTDLIQSMEAVRAFVSAGLEARATAGIKVRQPLRSATVNVDALDLNLEALIRDELNVKTLHYLSNQAVTIVLDTKLDDELRAEGLARDIARCIQQLRKDAKLVTGALATVTISGEHGLLSLLKDQTVSIEDQTHSSITWSRDATPNAADVDGLSVRLTV